MKLLLIKARSVYDLPKGESQISFSDFVKVVDYNGDISEIHNYLDCDCFDIVGRRIGGKTFDIFCDDEGLLKRNILSYQAKDDNYSLVGNLLITNTNEEGETIGLSASDIDLVISNIVKVLVVLKGKFVFSYVIVE